MFFETIKVNNKTIRRFEPLDFQWELKTELDNKDKKMICQISNDFFDDFSLENLNTRLKEKTKHLLSACYFENQMIAFKLGYEESDGVFYSWLGAINKNYHGFGIGKELFTLQKSWCIENGYKKITTKTMNCWKAMLILNIKNGFSITGTETSKTGDLKIIMEKLLSH